MQITVFPYQCLKNISINDLFDSKSIIYIKVTLLVFPIHNLQSYEMNA